MDFTGEVWWPRHRPDSIGTRFDGGPNALNFVRLCLALEVVMWHAYALRGSSWLPARVEHFVGDVAVDSFFAISGYLVCRSWQRRRSTWGFVMARARRILPGLWLCLLVTAFCIAPAASLLSGSGAPTWDARLHYVMANAGVWVNQYAIAGGTVEVPRPVVWNGSLWSLGYEAACYGGFAALGVCRLLRPGVVAGIAVLMWMTAATAMLVGAPLAGGGGPVTLTVRTVLMFCCGALLYLHRGRVPASTGLAVGALVLLAAGSLTPDYRVVAAPSLAYLAVYGGVRLGRYPRLRLRSDLSYGVYVYGFPLQQAFLLCGVAVGWFGFTALSIAATLSAAFLSWHLVERRMIGARSSHGRLLERSPFPVDAVPR